MTNQKDQQDNKPQQSDQGTGQRGQQGGGSSQREGGEKQFHNPKYHPKPGHGGPGDPSGEDEGTYGT
jgi:hypothetical protein